MAQELRAAFIAARQKAAGPEFAYQAALPGHPAALRAQNPVHHFTAELSADGARLIRPSGTVSLRLAAWGCTGAMSLVAPSAPQLSQTNGLNGSYVRAEFARGPITEWYQNGPMGLEQGFSISTPSPCTAAGARLRLEVALTGADSVKQKMGTSELGPQIELALGGDRDKLSYSDLYATDADGKRLPAEMSLQGDRVVLSVDTRGARYPLVVDPLLWAQETKLTPSVTMSGSQFGSAVAISGNLAVVGDYAASPAGLAGAGAAYVFVKSGSTWTQQAVLTAGDMAANAAFGLSVAISGSTIVVGSNGAAPSGLIYAGTAYVFVQSGATWTQQAELTASDKAAFANFGAAVAISGSTLVVGARYASPSGISRAGAAYVFVQSGSTWTQQAELTASDMAASALFGNSVGISGPTLVVGAPGAAASGTFDAGAAYIFVSSGSSWIQQAKLSASDKAVGAGFGDSVAIFGSTVAVGAPSASPGGTFDAGAAYVFVQSGSAWTQQAELIASDKVVQADFGSSVAVSGSSVVVGAGRAEPGGTFDAGAAYVFVQSGSAWAQQAELIASDKTANAIFGSSVSIDGALALIGASNIQAAYVFHLGNSSGESCTVDSDCAYNVCVAGTCGKTAGTACAVNGECKSGFCTDGVCCGSACSGGTTDCQACSKAAGAASDGSCSPLAAGTACASANASTCIAGGTCNGTATTCNLMPASSATVCSSSSTPASCIANYRCDGVTTGSCPTTNPTPANSSTICSATEDSSRCIANYRCDGVTTGSCPTTNPSPAQSSTVCNAAGNSNLCVATYRCDGATTGSCPTTNPIAANSSTVCSVVGDISQCISAYSCDGINAGSCPKTHPVPAGAGAVCHAGDSSKCDAGGVCNGTATGCSIQAAAPGVICNSTPDLATCRANYKCDGKTLGSCPTTNPTPANSSTVCSFAGNLSQCIASYKCDGIKTGSCPTTNPTPANSFTTCNAAGNASLCIASYKCDGIKTGSCPTTNPTPANSSTICNAAGNASLCAASYSCDGTTAGSCPTSHPVPAAAGTSCRAASGCDSAGLCNGSTTTCPAVQPQPDNTSCSAGSCQGGQCRPECDLSVKLSAVPQTTLQQQPVTVSVHIGNSGKSPASQISLNLALPTSPGFAVKQIDGQGWTCQTAKGMLSCSAPQVPVGGAPDLTLSLVPPVGLSSFAISATVSSPTFDANLLNNSAQIDIDNSAPCAMACPAGNDGNGNGNSSGGGPQGTGCQVSGRSTPSTGTWMLLLAAALLLRRRSSRTDFPVSAAAQLPELALD